LSSLQNEVTFLQKQEMKETAFSEPAVIQIKIEVIIIKQTPNNKITLT